MDSKGKVVWWCSAFTSCNYTKWIVFCLRFLIFWLLFPSHSSVGKWTAGQDRPDLQSFGTARDPGQQGTTQPPPERQIVSWDASNFCLNLKLLMLLEPYLIKGTRRGAEDETDSAVLPRGDDMALWKHFLRSPVITSIPAALGKDSFLSWVNRP